MKAASSSLPSSAKKGKAWYEEFRHRLEGPIRAMRAAKLDRDNNLGNRSKHEFYRAKKAEVQRLVRVAKKEWWEKKADNMWCFSEENNAQGFFAT